jgi:hypothetical protein
VGYATRVALRKLGRRGVPRGQLEGDLARMHDIGPKAIAQLRDPAAAARLSFATEN